MKIIAVMNQKGGIGKTMTAAAIAYIMGARHLNCERMTADIKKATQSYCMSTRTEQRQAEQSQRKLCTCWKTSQGLKMAIAF